jgi:hypothetical protein
MTTEAAPGCRSRTPCDRAAAAGHRLVNLPRFADPRGQLAVIECGKEIGFLASRVYFMYGAGVGSARGAHAHRRLEQLIVALQGSFDIMLDNGAGTCTHRLDTPSLALYLGPMIWREMRNFTADSLCFVLASEPYDDADYIRDHDVFLNELRVNELRVNELRG